MRLACFLALLGQAWSSSAQPSSEEIGNSFTQALQAQNQGDIARAIALYETILKEGMTSSELHNNLGLAYQKAGKYGLSIVHFERALRENRSNTDAYNNLQLAKSKIQDPIPPAEEMFIVRAWIGLRGLFTAAGWGIVFLLLLWTAAGWWAWNWKTEGELSNGRLAAPYTILGIAFFAFVFGFQQLSTENDSRTAIVVRPQAGLRGAPDLGSPEALLLPEGTQLLIVEQSDDWWQVELQNGTIGWLLANMVEKI